MELLVSRQLFRHPKHQNIYLRWFYDIIYCIGPATAALYYAEGWIEKIQLAENRQTEHREKTEKSITETILFDGSLDTITSLGPGL